MDNQELSAFIVEQMTLVERGYIPECEAAAQAFRDAGIEANCFVQRGGANLTPRETMLWYAGQLINCVNNKSWFAINSMINCMDKFAVQPARQN